MKTLSVNKDVFNRIRAGKTEYFATDVNGKYALIPSQCPHRGGPLHLGSASKCRAKLVCPWHDNAYHVSRLDTKGLPLVRTGTTIHLVVPNEDTVIWKEYLPGIIAAQREDMCS
ncbi:Rieske 2Fe-2S domain-containing protein [Pseudomonas mediterranea]|uniref:Rieske 2Fe-2S domain-containing protein n=1 Tax=Pseudomonas mediterranea TaxID=183795 RepID=UPI0013160443|nr:Rieske 2Fe-2S domain-containing protein [Pseudomonas mediterranea]MBL0843898.1 Rieske 2Fe-2S domain-containing protein [Pseudomonas mediterranea]QHA80244.1 Rieske 2Fe-2S domain-containing protein [Pseudomonas mediterranea]